MDAHVSERTPVGRLNDKPHALPGEPPFYTEEELDRLYERDPVLAMRRSRRQAELQRILDQAYTIDPATPMPTLDALAPLVDQARSILRRDGGDIELIGIEDGIVSMRMTGSCAGCPRSALDFKNVVERLVRSRFPQVRAVRRVFG